MQKHDTGKGLKKKMVFGCWSCQILISGVIWIQIVLVGVAIIVKAVVCEYHVADNEIRNHRVHFTQLFRRTFFLHMIFAKSMGLRQVCSFILFSWIAHHTPTAQLANWNKKWHTSSHIIYIYIRQICHCRQTLDGQAPLKTCWLKWCHETSSAEFRNSLLTGT